MLDSINIIGNHSFLFHGVNTYWTKINWKGSIKSTQHLKALVVFVCFFERLLERKMGFCLKSRACIDANDLTILEFSLPQEESGCAHCPW